MSMRFLQVSGETARRRGYGRFYTITRAVIQALVGVRRFLIEQARGRRISAGALKS